MQPAIANCLNFPWVTALNACVTSANCELRPFVIDK